MRKSADLCHGPILSKIVVFAIPILLTGLVQRLFNAADVVLASWLGTSGNDAVAAVGSTTALTNLMISFFIGCASGSAVKLSHAVGRGGKEEIRQTLHTAVLLAVTLGGILTVFGMSASEWLLRLMGTPQQLMGLSTSYLRAYFLGMIPYMVYNFGAAILRAVGETQKPFYFLLISGPFKLLLTVLFVKVCNLDVMGLALATTVSQIISAALVVISLMRRDDACRLVLRELRFYAKPLKSILQFGIPSGIQSATFSLSGVVIQSSVNSLSHLEGFLTGNAAAVSIESFADAITSSYFQTAITSVGQNVGARRLDRVRKIYFYLALLAVGLIGIVSLLVCLFPEVLLSLYIKGDPKAVHWGTVRLIYFFSPLILQGLMDTTSGCVRGFGASFSPMLISLVGVCGFRIAWMLTVFRIPAYHTPECLYLAYPISWAIAFVADLLLFKRVYKKEKRLADQE